MTRFTDKPGSNKTVTKISNFIREIILTGNCISHKPSLNIEYCMRKIDDLSSRFTPFSTIIEFSASMRTFKRIHFSGDIFDTKSFITELNSWAIYFYEDAMNNNKQRTDEASIALFLHALFHATESICPNALTIAIADLLMVNHQCDNRELAKDLMILGNLYFSQTIMLTGNNDSLLSVLNYFMNPLPSAETHTSIDFDGLLRYIQEYNNNLIKDYIPLETFPYNFQFEDQPSLDSFLQYLSANYEWEIVQKLYLFETQKEYMFRMEEKFKSYSVSD